MACNTATRATMAVGVSSVLHALATRESEGHFTCRRVRCSLSRLCSCVRVCRQMCARVSESGSGSGANVCERMESVRTLATVPRTCLLPRPRSLESHVHTSAADMREFGLDATSLAGAYAGPTEYVGLVYSLGYGENEVRCCSAWLGCTSVLLRLHMSCRCHVWCYTV